MKFCKVYETFGSFGGPLWRVDDIGLMLGGIPSLITAFTTTYWKPDYTLSIYDDLEQKTIEVECEINEMPEIVDWIYHYEKASPLMFIGLNDLSESYVVGMTITRGRIPFGCYFVRDGKLIKRS